MIHAATKLALLKLDTDFRRCPRALWTKHYMQWYQHYRGIIIQNFLEVTALESEQGGAQ